MGLKERERERDAEVANADPRAQIARLDQNANQHFHFTTIFRCCDIAILQNKITEFSTDFKRLM
jgi:hypothetical protein